MAGIGKPFKKGEGGRPKGVPNKATREIQQFAKEFLESPEYRARLKIRIERGQAMPIETLLYHYGYGKPKERIEIEGNAPMPLVIELVKDRRQLGAAADPDAGDDSPDEE
jgi:hypothetical protein